MLPVHIREEVVALFTGGEQVLVLMTGLEHFPEPGEPQKMVVCAARGVVDGRAGFHQERPIAGLGEEEFARELFQRPVDKGRARLDVLAGGLGHAPRGRVEVRINPGIAVVEPDFGVTLVSPT